MDDKEVSEKLTEILIMLGIIAGLFRGGCTRYYPECNFTRINTITIGEKMS